MTVVAVLGYGLHVRLVSKSLIVLSSVSFLAITLSGFHLHVDAVSHDEKAPHEHVHSYLTPLELDEDHNDVSVFEPATDFSDGEVIAMIPALVEFELAPRADGPPSAASKDPSPQHHFRWRPELRAPPSSI